MSTANDNSNEVVAKVKRRTSMRTKGPSGSLIHGPMVLAILAVLSLSGCEEKENHESPPTSKEKTMSIMKDSIKRDVKKDLSQLPGSVKLIVFTQDMECELCADNRTLMEELASLSDKVSTDVYDFKKDKDPVQQYGIDKIPAVAILGKKDYGIRFYGVPGGYEFSSLLHAIKTVSTGESGLSSESKQILKGLTKPVHIQVFVTPTCPYCPGAVQIAHKAAMESDHVTADMVEIQEFPQLAVKYNVMGVPKIVINESVQFTGALPENQFVQKILDAAK